MTKVALITGSAKRIAKIMAKTLHADGFNIVIHYRHSQKEAEALCDQFNQERKDSAQCLQADLNNCDYDRLVQSAAKYWDRLDVLINSASMYYATPIGKATPEEWDDLFASNCKAPFFLSQAAFPFLKKTNGAIINISDINSMKLRSDYPVYCVAKAGLNAQTKFLARELAPSVRVNAIAFGPMLSVENPGAITEEMEQKYIEGSLLKRKDTHEDIAKALRYLVCADFVTGNILTLDGGRSV
ncbi:MAG: pteridine reductase [Gammaproteobacteria bacterium]